MTINCLLFFFLLKNKPHQCSQCAKSFSTPGDLRCHMHMHNGTWPFRCIDCNRGFSKQANFKRHLASHKNEKENQILS